jgi:hypothetical protein
MSGSTTTTARTCEGRSSTVPTTLPARISATPTSPTPGPPPGVDLTGADLSQASLVGAHLNGAILGGATLTDADLTRASLIGADLRSAKNVRGVTWDRARLTGAHLPPDTVIAGWGTAAPDGRVRLEFGTRAGACTQISWRNHGDLLAVARGARIEIWDPGTGGELAAGHPGRVWSVAWSPDGARLASSGFDGVVRIWDPGTGSGHDHVAMVAGAGVRSLAFSADNRYIAAGTEDGYVAIIDLGLRPSVTRRLLGLPDGGWAVFEGDDKYRLHGDPAGLFWWSSGLCRFEPGELDGYAVERLRP